MLFFLQSIAERLRKKNQELLTSTDRISERTSVTDRTSIGDRYSSARDRDSTTSSIRDRNTSKSSTSTVSSSIL